MIRINLLKTVTHKKVKKQSAGLPKWVPVVSSIIILVLLAGGAGYYLVKNKKKPEPPLPQVVQKTDFKPSTHVKPNMIEDVVKEVSDERASNQRKGFINLSYDEMSFAEKINYEVFFAYNILDSLSSIVPAGIGFKTLEIDNFLTMYSIGIANNSPLVSEMFANLKTKLGLQPQPYSTIKENGKGSYQFIITCKPAFGVDLANPYQPIDHLFTKDELPQQLSEFTKKATQFKLTFSEKPVTSQVSKIREFNRYEYTWQCTGTYKDFVQFVKSLNKDQFPCAFRSIHIKAVSGGKVTASANLIFTAKE